MAFPFRLAAGRYGAVLLGAGLAAGAGAEVPPAGRPPGVGGPWSAGMGAAASSLPYRGADDAQLRVIPVITYMGQRVRIVGPGIRVRLASIAGVAVEATGQYAFGAYEEDDSRWLRGLGDRDDSVLGGLAVSRPLGLGVRLRVGYQHDLLDRIGGGTADLSVQRSWPVAGMRVTPSLGVEWISPQMAHDRYGVPARAATAGRPAYRPGSAFLPMLGLRAERGLTANWRFLLSLALTRLDDDVVRSPIVSDDLTLSGFGALTWSF